MPSRQDEQELDAICGDKGLTSPTRAPLICNRALSVYERDLVLVTVSPIKLRRFPNAVPSSLSECSVVVQREKERERERERKREREREREREEGV
jgi:hypothetical protein